MPPLNTNEKTVMDFKAIRRELHSRPELSGEEKETARHVESALREFEPTKIVRHVGGHGLLAEYAKQYDDAVIVKGLRASTDFENEFQMAQINKMINPALETMFLTSSEKYTFLSSSMVRELAGYGADLSEFVPREIIDEVLARAQGGKCNG